MGILKLKSFRKARHRSVYEPSLRMLSQIYDKQLAQDHAKVMKQIMISLIVFIVIEAIRLALYESLLDGLIDWDEILSIIGFLIILLLLPIKHFFFQKKKSNKAQKLEMAIKICVIIGDCALISIRFFNFGPLLFQNMVEGKYDFNLLGLGTSIVPNLVISDIVFTKWLEKCVIPIYYMLNIGFLILKYQPNNLGALLLRVFMYSLYIFIGFWVKERLHWKVFLHRAGLDEWNEVHKEILQNVPENIAVYAMDGKLLYKNQFFKKLQGAMDTHEGESDILSCIVNIRRRKNFLSLKTQTFQKDDYLELEELEEGSTKLNKMFEETPASRPSFKNLSEVLKFVEKAYQEGNMSSKTCMTLDGQYREAHSQKMASMEIKVSLYADKNGICSKIILILKDTTERDTLALLESNNQFKDNMLASVSHEIRTPLNGLKSLVEACLYDVDIPDESKNKYLIPAFRSAEMLDSIVNDVLDYLSLTRKGLKMYFRAVDIIQIFEECHEIMKIYTAQKNIDFSLRISKDVPRFVRTDPTRLRQITLNLLSNAFKFTIKGSVAFIVEKEGPFTRVSIQDSGKGMNEETKKKLAHTLLENIKGANIKGEKVTQQSSGIGLGLTVSHMISILLGPIEKSGLGFESELNQGSTFTFLLEDKEAEVCPVYSTLSRISSKNGIYLTNLPSNKKIALSVDSPLGAHKQFDLPLAINDSMSTPDEGLGSGYNSDRSISNVRLYASNFTPSRGFHKLLASARLSQEILRKPTAKCVCPEILAVDDEPMNILALSVMMKRFKCPIDTALSGEIALSIIKKRRENPCSSGCKKHRLIFMDLNMPGIDGFETTMKIRQYEERYRYDKSIIVACTAYLEQDYKQRCFDNGMDDFINKPLTQSKLFDILSKSGCLSSQSA